MLSTPPFTVNKADYDEYRRHATSFALRLPTPIRWLLYLFPAALVVLFAWPIIAGEGQSAASSMGMPILLLVATYVIFLIVIPKVQWKKIKADPVFNYDTVVSIDAGGMSTRNGVSDGYFAWKAVPKVSETDNLLLIYVSSASAVLIPKRVFPAAVDAEAFFKQVKKYMDDPIDAGR